MNIMMRCLAVLLTGLDVCFQKLKPIVRTFGPIFLCLLYATFGTLIILALCSFPYGTDDEDHPKTIARILDMVPNSSTTH
jgi:hypothetical protein